MTGIQREPLCIYWVGSCGISMAAGLYLVQSSIHIVIGAVILLYVANCLLNQKVWIRKTKSWGTKEEYPKIFKMNIIGGTLIGLYVVITSVNFTFGMNFFGLYFNWAIYGN